MPGSRPLALERFLGQSLGGQSLQTRQGLSPDADSPGSGFGLGGAERIPRDAYAGLRVRPELVEPAVRADAESRDGLITVVAPNSFGIEREPRAHPRRRQPHDDVFRAERAAHLTRDLDADDQVAGDKAR